MQTIVLAGGRGSRLAEETATRPKPMVEVGGRPILWHVMQCYASYGHKDFLVACGYMGGLIKEYFHNYSVKESDYFIDFSDGSREVVKASTIDWRVGVIDTGLDTLTGGRVLRLRGWLGDATFMVTYGDGVGDIDISALLDFHRSHGRLATLTAVRPPSRFGAIELEGHQVAIFSEKPQTGEGWINGGFFVFEPGVLDYIEGDETVLERETLGRLAEDGQLMAYRHLGFWHPMDTLRDRELLEDYCKSGELPWFRPRSQSK